MLSGPRSGALFVLGLFSASFVGACAPQEPPEVEGPWADRVAELDALATSDFERDVLADGVVSRAEYDEANQRLTTCMEDVGQLIELVEQGGYYVYGTASDAQALAALDQCQEGTTALVGGLFVDMYTNPDNIDDDEAVLACIKREGLVPEALTLEEYLAGDGATRTDESGTTSQSPWRLPFAQDDPTYDACMVNPALGARVG